MDDEIKVGRRFFKEKIKESEFSRIKAGLPRAIEPENYIKRLMDELKKETSSFSKFLKSLKAEFGDTLQRKSLPMDPFWYPADKTLGGQTRWTTTLPADATQEQIATKGMGLDKYLLHLGYDYHSLEHLAGEGIYLIFVIENCLDNGDKDTAIELVFGLGRVVTLYGVYLQMAIDSIRGGKHKVNPWRAYGQQLLKKNPQKSQKQIWGKIPTETAADENEPDYCGDFFFFKRILDIKTGKVVLVAVDDKTGQEVSQITYESFRTRYLSKKISRG